MLRPTYLVSPPIKELLGELEQFAARLGAPSSLLTLASPDLWLARRSPTPQPGVYECLQKYKTRLLFALEFPAVVRAFHHASRYELRELIELDRRLSKEIKLPKFASASQKVGRAQLNRLRPLKDQRLLQRYWAAIHQRKARGWHMLVYGMTLSIYSLPLRQGLINYGRHTLNGLLQSAAPPALGDGLDQALSALCQDLPQAVEDVLSRQLDAGLQLA